MNKFSLQLTKGYSAVSVLILFFCALYLKLVVFTAVVQVDLELVDVKQAVMKIYWAGEGKYFTENKMREVKVSKGRQTYNLRLPVLHNQHYLRVDPIDRKGQVVIHTMRISQTGFEHIELNDKDEFSTLTPSAKHIESLQINDAGVSFHSTGNDPNLSFNLNFDSIDIAALINSILIVLFIALLCLTTYKYVVPQLDSLVYVPVLGCAVITLCIAMAISTKIGLHPDEWIHVQAVNYFQQNNLPPALNAKNIENTYSIYGVTRLASYEVFYPFAGYLSRAMEYVEFNVINHARLFNLILIVSLFALSWCYSNLRYFVVPLLITAQGWYLFSYANSDAFGLFICILVSYQVAYEQSLFNRYLTEEKPHLILFSTLLLGALFGFLLLIKVNYFFFALFAGMFVLWRYCLGEFKDKRLFWKRLIILILIGLAPITIRYALDVSVNGFDRDTLYEQMREQYADPAYKPSRPLEGTPPHLYMKSKGVSIDEIYYKHRWAEKSFRTAFGSYGYSQYHASELVYDLIRYSGLMIVSLIVLAIVMNGTSSGYILLALAALCSTMLLGASFYSSWTVAFQPQGRYLMPILPILAILYYRFKSHAWELGMRIMVLWMFLIATYSFIFIGLESF